MNNKNEQNEMLLGILEAILFKDEHLTKFKNSIEEFEKGEIKKKKLGEKLLRMLASMLEELLKNLTFYFDLNLKKQQIDDFAENKDTEKLEKEIEERNELLTLIAQKVGVISYKLNEIK